VSVSVASSSVAPPAPASTFAVSQISWRKGKTGLIASTVVATTGNAVPSAELTVVCIGNDGQILGAAYGPLHDLSPGVSKAVETIYETPPLSASQCPSAVGIVEALPVDTNGQ